MIDGGNKFIDDNFLFEDDRKMIYDKMVILYDDWNKLVMLIFGKQQRLVLGNYFIYVFVVKKCGKLLYFNIDFNMNGF